VFNLLVGGDADAFDLGQFCDVPERPVMVTVVYDGLCPDFTDSRQRFEQPVLGAVDVYLLR
jgi:hypothetical protein